MHVTQVTINGFKKFSEKSFSFNEQLNIVVGDNDSGKSTLLEAIELDVNGRYRGRSISSEVAPELFNVDAISAYLASDHSAEHLPTI